MARAQRLLLIIEYAPKGKNKVHWGGTAILIPFESIELKDKETPDQARDRILRTRRTARLITSLEGRATSVRMKVDGLQRTLVSAYAPAQPTPSYTRAEFFDALAPLINKKTVLAIDANCVQDILLDLKRTASTSPYENGGAPELQLILIQNNLIDVARESLNGEPFFTSHHIGPNGSECWSRIDVIYAPDSPRSILTHGACVDFTPLPTHRRELDHMMVEIRSEETEVVRGNELQYIREDILEDPSFLAKLHSRVLFYTTDKRTWTAKWGLLKEDMRAMCMAETKKRTFAETKVLREVN